MAGMDMPEVRPDGNEWLGLTRRWWDALRSSVQAERMGTEMDWYVMLRLAVLYDNFWRKPSTLVAAEIRQVEADFGFTPASRLRLKFEEGPSVEQYSGGSTVGSDGRVIDFDRYRERSLGVI